MSYPLWENRPAFERKALYGKTTITFHIGDKQKDKKRTARDQEPGTLVVRADIQSDRRSHDPGGAPFGTGAAAFAVEMSYSCASGLL